MYLNLKYIYMKKTSVLSKSDYISNIFPPSIIVLLLLNCHHSCEMVKIYDRISF